MFYSMVSRQYQSDGMSTVLPVNVLVRDLLNKHNVQSCTVFLMYALRDHASCFHRLKT